VDHYTFTVKAETLTVTGHYTGVCVNIHADFPLTATLQRDGVPLGTQYSKHVGIRAKSAQPGTYHLQVEGPTLNAYTLRARVCNPEGNERAYHLEAWLKDKLLPRPPKLLPDCLGGCGDPPDWFTRFPWDPDSLYAMGINGIHPVAHHFAGSGPEPDGPPLLFAVGAAEPAMLNVSLERLGGAAHAAMEAGEGVYALLLDYEGNEVWRVEGLQGFTQRATELVPGRTYLLMVNSSPGTQAGVGIELPGSRAFLPLVLRVN
jgi:hypothetical protein